MDTSLLVYTFGAFWFFVTTVILTIKIQKLSDQQTKNNKYCVDEISNLRNTVYKYRSEDYGKWYALEYHLNISITKEDPKPTYWTVKPNVNHRVQCDYKA